MSISITIKSRKLGKEVRFVARENSGYVFVNPSAADWGQQVLDRGGNAEVARDEATLRRVARRWIGRVLP